MSDNSRFPKLRIHQVFEIHLLRRRVAQAEDKGPFIIYVGRGHKLFCEHHRYKPVRGGGGGVNVQSTLCFRFAAMRFSAF